jgi:hypothetical protein
MKPLILLKELTAPGGFLFFLGCDSEGRRKYYVGLLRRTYDIRTRGTIF